ncbi:P-loop containing nucleoside triphosphate hydrolase protein [Saitoella complicata NRRL Y-17804]|uniref:AAA domain-containing protein n=1 Tax=Saitoella complicata (strain BCRC 22490 / CBS 7301 / JCM 7358 / NBRC 10748 / NRRL Y-17804) TaxID=698492 RepID=A0A0E9NC18_SAICN|nr:P-loop containing nucleoside triphosphate hydrolase protein [Saitoella complicata NRRL Y-17804]ODQ53847.1 P-loop containing nucleoside triphosphate hydrolase protein [Saitoella complicata NRRL Y-17804]GAO46945.1 hypothetical protein G7K_1162-t1 [Saitoella complicata NRRL Y-17804]
MAFQIRSIAPACRSLNRTACLIKRPDSFARLFSSARIVLHENPLGLPRSGAPPTLPRMQRGLPTKRKLPGVDRIIAVSSAKGGVGKSTVSVNTALALAQAGKRVGILDADIFGPSIPKLLKLSGEPRLSENNQLLPMSNYGLKSMSMGYLVGEEAPVVWRGAMVQKAMQQLLHEVEWGGLDYLIIDMPPGTGDVQLTIIQRIILDGAIIVSTPQDIALIDAVKGLNMFKKTDTPVIGMVQNMSVFVCPNCSTHTHIFGTEGVVRTAEKHGLSVIGDVPLHASICQHADEGKPTVVAEPESVYAQAYRKIASAIIEKFT